MKLLIATLMLLFSIVIVVAANADQTTGQTASQITNQTTTSTPPVSTN